MRCMYLHVNPKEPCWGEELFVDEDEAGPYFVCQGHDHDGGKYRAEESRILLGQITSAHIVANAITVDKITNNHLYMADQPDKVKSMKFWRRVFNKWIRK